MWKVLQNPINGTRGAFRVESRLDLLGMVRHVRDYGWSEWNIELEGGTGIGHISHMPTLGVRTPNLSQPGGIIASPLLANWSVRWLESAVVSRGWMHVRPGVRINSILLWEAMNPGIPLPPVSHEDLDGEMPEEVYEVVHGEARVRVPTSDRSEVKNALNKLYGSKLGPFVVRKFVEGK